MKLPYCLRLAAVCFCLSLPLFAWAALPELSESREIRFNDTDSQPLKQQAAALATPVAIYEYLHNNYDYSAYYGSRSSSSNTFLGERGNDVDLATTLIAMLRSQGVLARYAVGTVTVAAGNLANWLQVRNVDLAIQILTKQGVQGVVKSADSTTVNLEHVWVEAYVPYDRYRGSTATGCPSVPTVGCAWIGLDPSFKRHAMKAAPIDIYDQAGLTFDYTSYYNAVKSQDAARMDKNPLTIYQEQILAYLRTNNPGKTLDDVRDGGPVIAEVDGILPASLPYAVVGTPALRRYTSVADHDAAVGAAEAKKWGMQVKVTVQTETLDTYGTPTYDLYGSPIPKATLINAKAYFLSDLATQRLTLSFGDSSKGCSVASGQVCAILRVNGIVDTLSPVAASPSDIFIIRLDLDGAPATVVGGTDEIITASYYNSIANGYYLIGTGGETSNWSQTHRATQRLLEVSNPAGAIGTADPILVDEVTGGLLQTAMTLYFSKFRDTIAELDALNHVASPISGFVGVVSSVYDLQYYDGTAFGVLPGGLLIDMKGQRLSGTWRNNAANTGAPNHYLLLGHAMSSLEHEIWQELTGFDAVSTVRGIQMALSQAGTQLVNPKNVPSSNLATELPKFSLTNDSSIGNTRAYYLSDIFYSYKPGTPITWYASDWYIQNAVPMGATANLSFDALKKSVTAGDPAWRKGLIHYTYNSDYGSLYDWLYCYYSHHQAFYYANSSGTGPKYKSASYQTGQTIYSTGHYTGGVYTCGGTAITGYPYSDTNPSDSLWHKERAEFLNFYNKNATYLSYLDTTGNYPFVTSDFLYRNAYASPYMQTLGVVASIRDNLATSNKLEYLIPSQRTVTDYNQFMVYLAKGYDAAGTTLQSMTFAIQNWGGGFLPAEGLKTTRQSREMQK